MTLRKTVKTVKTFKTVSKWWNKGHTINKHLSIRPDEWTKIQIIDSVIKKNFSEKLSGVKINSKINFNKLVKQIKQKVNSKIKLFARVIIINDFWKKSLVISYFPNPNFDYCTVIWMLHKGWKICFLFSWCPNWYLFLPDNLIWNVYICIYKFINTS